MEEFRVQDEARAQAEKDRRAADAARQQAELDAMAAANARERAASEEAMRAEQEKLKQEQLRQKEAAQKKAAGGARTRAASDEFNYDFEPGMEGRVKKFRQRGTGGDALFIRIDHEKNELQARDATCPPCGTHTRPFF